MRVFASVRKRPVWIAGYPHSGWKPAESTESGAKLVPFDFLITDDGSDGYLLAYRSSDGVFEADSSHESVDEACECAREQFGIELCAWQRDT